MSKITKNQEQALIQFLNEVSEGKKRLLGTFEESSRISLVDIADPIGELQDILGAYLPPKNQPWSWALNQLKEGKAVKFNRWLSGIYMAADETGKLMMFNGSSEYDRSPMLTEFTECGWELADDE